MNNSLLGVGPLIIALTAVAVAIWNVRTNTAVAERANSLPVVSAVFDEFRSQEFQAHLRSVWNEAPTNIPEGGFQSLPHDWREGIWQHQECSPGTTALADWANLIRVRRSGQ